MPRFSSRRKADQTVSNNNKGEKNDAPLGYPEVKRSRMGFIIPLPTRPTVVGKVFTCGQGDVGQLGLGYDEARFERKIPAFVDIPNAVEVAAGGMHNLVLTSDGDVYSFGCNDEGALGRDTTEEGSEFVPTIINMPGKVIKISAGDSHSASILEDGSVFAWGSFRNARGNMGLTSDGNKLKPFHFLPKTKFVSICSGADHLVMLTNLGKVYTIGCGDQGQLGRVAIRSASGDSRTGRTQLLMPLEVFTKTRKPISEIWATNYCTFLREYKSDDIYGFGLNNYNQLAVSRKADDQMFAFPILTALKDVKQIAGGQHHTLVLNRTGEVHVIGRSDYGRLGLGELEGDIKELTLIKDLKDKNITYIACGDAQSFALSKDGELYAWGMGSNNQLGSGAEEDSFKPEHIVSARTKGRQVIRAGAGGQHSIFLAREAEDTSKKSINAKRIKAAKKDNSKK